MFMQEIKYNKLSPILTYILIYYTSFIAFCLVSFNPTYMALNIILLRLAY